MERARVRLDALIWTRWRAAIRNFTGSEVGGRAKAMLAALLALLVAINALNVVNSYVGRDFMTAIEARSMSGFVTMALLYLAVFAGSTLVAVVYRFTEERLGLLWREWLTRRTVAVYLDRGAYYWLREEGELANPDQRIADDVRTFTTMTLSLLLVLLNTTFTIVAFAGVMWSISPGLFLTAVGYAALGSVLTVVFGRPLVWLNYDQADREASLRADLVHVRENAESIAVLQREGRLGARLGARIDALVSNTRRIIAVNRNLGFFTTGYNYLIQIIPILIVAPLFIRGEAEFGVISQSAMAFSHLIGAFSLVITQFQQISAYAVVLARLGELGDSIEHTEERAACAIEYDDAGRSLAWERLTLRSPRDGALLVEALSLALEPGTRLLVTGPNEAARIALFRASARLWNTGEGRIVRPPPGDEILFVPERPYLPPGTLREAVECIGAEPGRSDADITALLHALGVEAVVARAGGYDSEQDWDDLLSLGEQQMLTVARVILAAPRFAVLDRPGTLLPPDRVQCLLGLLAERGITAITFSADEALAPFHDRKLVLALDGRWRMEPIENAVTPEKESA